MREEEETKGEEKKRKGEQQKGFALPTPWGPNVRVCMLQLVGQLKFLCEVIPASWEV